MLCFLLNVGDNMKIKQLIIKGFKRFKNFTIRFNDDLTIIVGENEAGKSTILEALDAVLNKRLFNKEDTSLVKYFNNEVVQTFFETGKAMDLPKIGIDIDLDLVGEIAGLNFSGVVKREGENQEKCGIHFEFCFDEEFINDVELSKCAENNVIPIEYYRGTWVTYSGKSYRTQMLPLKTIFLDNSRIKNNLYNSYARKIYIDKISENTRREMSGNFNTILVDFRRKYADNLLIQDTRRIGLDHNKTDLNKLVDIYENDISVQDMGKGKENIVKTEIALSGSTFDVICIEEPELHLSHSNTRKLIEFISESVNEQLIMTSHSSMIASRLNIQNVVWVSDIAAYSLKDISKQTAAYFKKIDNLDILKFILSERVILVEGAAEYILLPTIFKKIFGETLDKAGIEVISMGSISYANYREISEQLADKKVAVITDNDGSKDKTNIEKNFAVFSDSKIENWTLEVAFYKLNAEYFDSLYKDTKTEAKYNNKEYPKALAHMLKNKTENALLMVENDEDLKVPKYIEDALRWIKE